MCDTFVALADSTKEGKTIFGKNSDRPYDEVQNIVYFPPKKHDEKMVACTYIEIPQVKETLGILLCQPHWMWGAEMGTNESGVVIGNEAVWTNELNRAKGLLGMDLLRLALERGKNARNAMDIIIDLLEKHKQGGNCAYGGQMQYHNSFLIADKTDAWILETADIWWVAEHVSKGVRNISNELSIRKKYDLIRDGTIQHAIEGGYCKDDDDFDFARCFTSGGLAETVSPYSREGRCSILLKQQQGDIDVKSAMTILRDHEAGICMHGGFRSTASQITKIYNDNSTINWLTGTPEPCMGIFKPIFLPNPKLPDNLESTLIPETNKVWWAHSKYIQQASKTEIAHLQQLEEEFLTNIEFLESSELDHKKLNQFTLEAFQKEFNVYKK